MPDFVLAIKRGCAACTLAEQIARGVYPQCRVVFDLDERLRWIENGSTLVSFLFPHRIPAGILERCAVRVNFHPGPPAYPGIGCYNWALYEGETEYGSTCHVMQPKVDTGEILAVDRFPISPDETVKSLQDRTLARMLLLFAEFLRSGNDWIVGDHPSAASFPAGTRHQWSRRPFTRADLEELCTLTPEMDEAEMRQRIRATSYPGKPGARLKINGIEFVPTPDGNQSQM